MSEIFCQDCSDKSDESESLSLGLIGVHECVVCGKKIDTIKENYSVFKDGARERLKEKH